MLVRRPDRPQGLYRRGSEEKNLYIESKSKSCHTYNVGKATVIRTARQPSRVQIMPRQKQLENAQYFNYLDSVITNDVRCTREIECRIAMAQTSFNNKKAVFTSKLDLNLSKKLIMCYIGSKTLCVAETWTLRKGGQK